MKFEIPTPQALRQRLATTKPEPAAPDSEYLEAFADAVANATGERVAVLDSGNINRGRHSERARRRLAEYHVALEQIRQAGWVKINEEDTGIRDGSKRDIWIPLDAELSHLESSPSVEMAAVEERD